MELRASDGPHALTAERAAQSLDYWRATAQQLIADPAAPEASDPRQAYSHLVMAQANLFADRTLDLIS